MHIRTLTIRYVYLAMQLSQFTDLVFFPGCFGQANDPFGLEQVRDSGVCKWISPASVKGGEGDCAVHTHIAPKYTQAY